MGAGSRDNPSSPTEIPGGPENKQLKVTLRAIR